MGAIQSGIPKEETEFLKELMSLDTFIEGGTYYGGTSLYASRIFKNVFTIENSHVIFEKAKSLLRNIDNIKIFEGDTRVHLKELSQKNDNILYWLDSHWSGGSTYGEDDECPLLDELSIVFKDEKNIAVLIDDARLFLSPPSRPHKINNWPTIKEISDSTPKDYDIMIYNDVIYLIPVKYKKIFWEFVQEKETNKNSTSFRNIWLVRKFSKVCTYIKNLFRKS